MKKTLQECKDEVARQYGYADYHQIDCLEIEEFEKDAIKVSILENVLASQKDSPSKEEPVRSAEEILRLVHEKHDHTWSDFQWQFVKSAHYIALEAMEEYASQFKSSKEEELQKEIEQLRSRYVQSLKTANRDIELLQQSNKELLEALKEIAEKTYRTCVCDSGFSPYITATRAIEKHYNPPSTVNEKEEQDRLWEQLGQIALKFTLPTGPSASFDTVGFEDYAKAKGFSITRKEQKKYYGKDKVVCA